ncbi:MAG TPA: HEAT repeat domain-containing protein [Gemmatimonadales bacterium]|jgi:HEAT repeat protein|nr:HEAT repeat domain-containing protein [Gemmatimonadales bacterium]
MKMPTGAELKLPAQQVEELIRTLVKGLRTFQMYLPNNPMYLRAQQAIHDAFLPIWSATQQLTLSVVESDLVWEEEVVYRQPVKTESFAWMLYKDGMRQLNLRPGVEEEEIISFLQVASHARLLANDAPDDLLTLLWEQEFAFIDYQFAELSGESGPALVPQQDGGIGASVDADGAGAAEAREAVQAELGSELVGPAVGEREDFDSTLYFLDEQEIQLLKRQVDDEYRRDARRAAFDALLDTFELQPASVVREGILNIFDGLFPNLLNRGEFRIVAALLREFRTISQRVTVLSPELRARLESFQARLSDPAILSQLLQSLEEQEALPADEDLGQVLGELHSEGLETMLIFLPTLKRPAIRKILETSVDRLAAAHVAAVLELLGKPESQALAGAVGLCGRLQLQVAVPTLDRLVAHPDPQVRREAAVALGRIASPGALTALERALDDSDRSVRLAALAAVTEQGYRAALRRLEAVVQGRGPRELERAERRQFFEAYATLGDAEVLPVLADILAPRSVFRRKHSSEARTCAAYAIARLRTPAAREVLERVEFDKELPVRNAASRALREWRA